MTPNTTPPSGSSRRPVGRAVGIKKNGPVGNGNKPAPEEIRAARLLASGRAAQAAPTVWQAGGLYPYPTLLPLSSTPEIKGMLVYVIKHYGVDGLSVLIERVPVGNDVNLNIRYGDWRGNKTDLGVDSQASRAALYFQERYLKTFVETMRLIRIHSAQFYLAVGKDDLILIDIRQHQSKLTGPGMVRDIFGKNLPTQEVMKVEPLDEKVLAAIDGGFGSYQGDLILKPSAFKTVEREELGQCPLYVEVRR